MRQLHHQGCRKREGSSQLAERALPQRKPLGARALQAGGPDSALLRDGGGDCSRGGRPEAEDTPAVRAACSLARLFCVLATVPLSEMTPAQQVSSWHDLLQVRRLLHVDPACKGIGAVLVVPSPQKREVQRLYALSKEREQYKWRTTASADQAHPSLPIRPPCLPSHIARSHSCTFHSRSSQNLCASPHCRHSRQP